MGRKPKYEFGTKNISISLNKAVVDILEKHAIKMGISVSGLASKVFEHAILKDFDFHLVMAKHHASLLHYHRSESDRLKITELEYPEEIKLPWK